MPDDPLLVVALGAGALQRRGQPLEAATMLVNVRHAAAHLARLAQRYRLVVTHGNGPQVGLLARQNGAHREVQPCPLDVLDAQSEGLIGYLLEQEIANQLGAGRHVATLLTRVEIDPDDPAMAQATKPVGPAYAKAERDALARERGWRFLPGADGYRRAVPSPAPRRVLNLQAVQALLERGMVVVCAGGGGIPVLRLPNGELQGAEAVIDKDSVSSLLARQLQAQMFIVATDVPAVALDWCQPTQRTIRSAPPRALRTLPFAAGSMAPKVAAACDFAEATGHPAVIGNLADADRFASHEAGTWISTELGGLRT